MIGLFFIACLIGMIIYCLSRIKEKSYGKIMEYYQSNLRKNRKEKLYE